MSNKSMLDDILATLASGKTVTISLRVRPGAKETRLRGKLDDGSFKIDIKEAPEDGQATAALREFFASELDIPVAHVEILSGEHGRRKIMRVSPRL